MTKSVLYNVMNAITIRGIMFRSIVDNLFWINIQLKQNDIPLGRWTPKTCHSKTDMSNYYSNIDHCGECKYERNHIDKILNEKN
jgi:hypothetical protein